MAELKVQVQVVKQDALRDIQNIEQRLDAIEKNPVQIKFQVSGLEGTAQKMEQMASAQSRIATSAASAAISSNSFSSSQRSAAAAATQGAKQVDALEASYNKLGVTVANFAKYKAFAAITRGIRDSVSEMKKLDDELVTVRKVTDATQKELDQITKKSYEVGSKYGKAPSDYAAGVAEFARAGYRETADDLAELSIKAQLVGDMSATVANKFLLATDAAYGYNGSIKELSAVLDGMNAIDNNFATSIEKISTGLGKVAPIASQAHVGVNELSAAIGTITAVTQRSGEEAATALRALFLNIMGDTKTEIEDGAKWTAGEIDGLRDILERYAPAAVAAAEATGQVINPMEAMRGLAQSMKEGILTEQELMQMVTDIGGKLRSSQLLAIVQNWDVYESMLSTYKNAAGSADAEISKMMDGWSVKAQQLETSFTKMLSGLADSRTAKDALDFLRGVVEALDTDLGRAVISAAAFGIAMTGVATAAKKLISVLSSPTPIGWIGIAAAGISLLHSGINELFPSYDQLTQKSEEAQQKYADEQKKLEEINAELQNNYDRIAELQGMGSLTYAEESELARLQSITKELEKQKELYEANAAAASKDSAMSAAEASNKLLRPGEFAGDNIADELEIYSIDDFQGATIKQLADFYTYLASSEAEAAYGAQFVKDSQEAIEHQLAKTAQELTDLQDNMEVYYQKAVATPESERTSDQKFVISAYESINEQLAVREELLKRVATLEQASIAEAEARRAEKLRASAKAYMDAANEYYSGLKEEQAYWADVMDEEGSFDSLYSDDVKKINAEVEAYERVRKSLDNLISSRYTDEDVRLALNSLLAQENELSSDAADSLLNYAFARREATKADEEASLAVKPEITITNADGTIDEEGTSSVDVDTPEIPDAPPAEEYKALSAAIDETLGKYNLLRQAMHEVNETGLVSEETFKGLTDAGIDLGNVYKDDATGAFKVSGDTIKDALYETEDLLNDLSGSDLDFDTEGLDAFDKAIKDILGDLNELEKMLADMGESGDAFREYQDIYGDAMGMLGEGRTGTNAFAAYLQTLFNEDVLADIGNDAKKAGEYLNDELISGMLDKDKSGAELAAFMAENFDGAGAVFKDLGDSIETTITDWDAFSKSTGLSVSVLQSLFGYIDEYSGVLRKFGETGEETAKSFDDIEKGATHVENGIKKIKLSDFIKDSAKAGKSAEEIAEAVDNLGKKAEKGDIELEIDVEDTEENIQRVVDEQKKLVTSDKNIEFTTNAEDVYSKVRQLHQEASDTAGTYKIKFVIERNGQIPQFNAAGTDYADEGPSVVNELGPELIVSRGRAFIAGDGRPTIVDLHEGDIVYNHLDTEAILAGRTISSEGISSFAAGSLSRPTVMNDGGSNAVPTVSSNTPKPDKKSNNKKGGGGGSSGGGSRSSKGDKDEDWWSIVEDWFGYYTDQNQRAIDRLSYQIELLENDLEDLTAPLEKQIDQIERLNDQIDRQMELLERQQDELVKPIQDEINALEKAKDIQDEQLELAEKQKAVEEARNELQNAQNERTIRYFNEQKGQWEWMADKGAVADAQKALEDAEKELADYEYEMHISSLERQIEQIEDVYGDKIAELEGQQTANDDLIYDLEQQILAAEDAYNAAIEPLEKQVTELERQLKAIEEAWAEAEMPYTVPEDDLSKALSNIGGTSAELAAVKAAIESIKSASKTNLASTQNAASQTVSVSPTKSTQEQYGEILAEMGVLFGASNGSADTSSYNTSNVSTIYDYSGAITIGGITITGDPSDITLADLIDDIGIYVQR